MNKKTVQNKMEQRIKPKIDEEDNKVDLKQHIEILIKYNGNFYLMAIFYLIANRLY